jgi:hypothetical protein
MDHNIPSSFSDDEWAELNRIMSEPLTVELEALKSQGKNEGYMHESLYEEIQAEMKRIRELDSHKQGEKQS